VGDLVFDTDAFDLDRVSYIKKRKEKTTWNMILLILTFSVEKKCLMCTKAF